MEFPRRGCLAFLLLAALAAFILSLFIACGHGGRGWRVAPQLTPPEAVVPPGGTGLDEPANAGPPPVEQLGFLLAGAGKGACNGTQAVSLGADYGAWGSTSARDYSVEAEGTAVNLRAYAPGDYAYAVFMQRVGEGSEPLQTLIDTEVCKYGGGQDDDVPLVYYLGIADRSYHSWRWFGVFREVDVLLTVNREGLKSRFTWPGEKPGESNYYLCVLTVTPGKAVSALPAAGVVAPLPLAPLARAAAQEGEDPGGVRVEVITTDLSGGLQVEPVMVTGLQAAETVGGVVLSWDANADPNVFLYQVQRSDLPPPGVLKTVGAEETQWTDDSGLPGREYTYRVRARNDAGWGGLSSVKAARKLSAPTVTASDGAFGDHVHVIWTAVAGAEGYRLWRAEAPEGARTQLAEFGAGTLSADDYGCVLEQVYYYWVQALGEDREGPLGGPDAGFALVLEPLAVRATDGDWPGRVELTWGELEEPLLTAYNVYRDEDEDEAGAELLDAVAPPEHTFSDTTAAWAVHYYYFVKPVVVGEEQPRGEGDWGWRGLSAPANVTATPGTDALKVAVSWEAVNNATRYRVFRSFTADDPNPSFIAEVTAPLTDYDDAPGGWGEAEGTHYYYFIAALHTGPDTERSDYGGPAAGWRSIGTPANVNASQGTQGDRVVVAWTAVPQAAVYQVFRDGAPLGEPVAAPAVSCSDYTPAFGAHHSYAVKAGIALGYGALSAGAEGWRGLLAPTGVQASDGAFTDRIRVSWNLVSTASGYRIYRSLTDDDPNPPYLASVSGGTATSYDDFTAAPNTQYWYSVAGYYDSESNLGLRSADEVGTIGNKSPVADLQADPTEGDAPLTVDFDASGSYDEDGTIVKYEWDWTNDGSYDYDSGTDPTVSHEYTTAGEYTCKVRVTDDDGAVDTDTIAIKALQWAVYVIDSNAGTACDVAGSLAVVDGRPAVAYRDVAELKYVRANNSLGTSWGTPVTLESSIPPDSQNISLAVVDGKPAVAYHKDYRAMYVRASDSTGSEWGTPVEVYQGTSQSDSGCRPYLAVVNGHPAMSFGDGDVMYVRASDEEGTTWGDPIVPYDEGQPAGFRSSICIVNGKPAIAYQSSGSTNTLMYIRAYDANGVCWGVPIELSRGEIYSSYKLVVANGYPAVEYREAFYVYFKRASDISGETWNDGVSVGLQCYGAAIGIADGKPAIAYRTNTTPTMKYRRSNDANGDSWGQQWDISNTGNVFQNSVAEVNGNHAFVFTELIAPDPNYKLKFAIRK